MNLRKLLGIAALAVFALPIGEAAANDITKSLVYTEGGDEDARSPWSGSSISYDHFSAAVGLKRDAELTWNPVYVHGVTLMPQYAISNHFLGRLRFDLQQELTDSDYTTKKHETEWSDLFLELIYLGWHETVTDIRLSGSLRVGVPFSKISTAQSLLVSMSPSITASRSFDVLQGLNLSLTGRFNQRIYDATTGQYDGHGIIGCADTSCDPLRNTGFRNSPWDVSVGPSVTLRPVDDLILSANMAVGMQHLYALGDAEVPVSGGTEHLKPRSDDPNNRYISVFGLGVAYILLDELTLSAGVTTAGAQQAPDSTRRSPFFNRLTAFTFGLNLDVDALVAKL